MIHSLHLCLSDTYYYFLPSFSRLPLISYIQRASIITFWCRCGQSRAAWAPWPAPSWPTSSGPRTATPSVPSETVWARINASLCRTRRQDWIQWLLKLSFLWYSDSNLTVTETKKKLLILCVPVLRWIFLRGFTLFSQRRKLKFSSR